jgi:hypothetical protein
MLQEFTWNKNVSDRDRVPLSLNLRNLRNLRFNFWRLLACFAGIKGLVRPSAIRCRLIRSSTL